MRMFVYDQLPTVEALEQSSLDLLSVLLRSLTLLLSATELLPQSRRNAYGIRCGDLVIAMMLFLVVGLVAGCDHGVQLGKHDRTLSNSPKLSSGEFVHEMAEDVVIFFLSFDILDGKLKLALNSVHEKIVDDDVVGRIIKFVFYSHQFELSSQYFVVVKKVHCFQDVDKTALAALKF